MTDICQEIRDDMMVKLYKPMPEFHMGAPTLRECGHHNGCNDGKECTESITCPCGDDHGVMRTSYGFRSECPELGVRWTSLNIDTVQVSRVDVRAWVAEPYDTMAIRTTK